MKRDDKGSYWPEPADLEKGCPVCGAEIFDGCDSLHFYGCGSAWSYSEGLRDTRCVTMCDRGAAQDIINARQSRPAIVREVLEWVALKYDPQNRAGIFPSTSDAIKALWNRDHPELQIPKGE